MSYRVLLELCRHPHSTRLRLRVLALGSRVWGPQSRQGRSDAVLMVMAMITTTTSLIGWIRNIIDPIVDFVFGLLIQAPSVSEAARNPQIPQHLHYHLLPSPVFRVRCECLVPWYVWRVAIDTGDAKQSAEVGIGMNEAVSWVHRFTGA